MNEFKVGDLVKVSYYTISELAGQGQYGTVINVKEEFDLVGVKMLETGKVFYFKTNLLELVHDPAESYYAWRSSKRYDKHQDSVINNLDIRDAIKNVIFNNPATVVYWTDGTKTVVKAENEDFDPEKGLAMAISKKVLGNKGNYYETFKK